MTIERMEGTIMVKYREILRLAAMGVSQNGIAFSCGCAQSTVSDVLRTARAHRVAWPLLEEMDDAAIREVIEARDCAGSLILRSRFAPSAWHAKLGNGAIADAVIDRIVYKSHVIHIEGEESMRKRMGGIK